MRPLVLAIVVALDVAGALQLPRPAAVRAARTGAGATAERRAFLAAGILAAAVAVAPPPAGAKENFPSSVFDSTCLGFGCNSYGGIGFGGMAAPTDEDSIPFVDFTAQLKDPDAKSKISRVDIYGSAGDKVYVTYADGKKIRLGEGTPIEDDKGWSSSLWLVRILDNVSVPHTYHFRPADTP